MGKALAEPRDVHLDLAESGGAAEGVRRAPVLPSRRRPGGELLGEGVDGPDGRVNRLQAAQPLTRQASPVGFIVGLKFLLPFLAQSDKRLAFGFGLSLEVLKALGLAAAQPFQLQDPEPLMTGRDARRFFVGSHSAGDPRLAGLGQGLFQLLVNGLGGVLVVILEALLFLLEMRLGLLPAGVVQEARRGQSGGQGTGEGTAGTRGEMAENEHGGKRGRGGRSAGHGGGRVKAGGPVQGDPGREAEGQDQPERPVAEQAEQEAAAELSELAGGLGKQSAEFVKQGVLVRRNVCVGFFVGPGKEAPESAVTAKGALGGPFEGRQQVLLGSQSGLVLLESLEVGGEARFTVALGLEHRPLELVFSSAGFGFDLLEALFLAGLAGPGDADLPAFATQLEGLPGGGRLSLGLGPGLGGLPGQFLEGRLVPQALASQTGPQILVELVGPGGQVPHGGPEGLQEFETLAGSGVAIHNLS